MPDEEIESRRAKGSEIAKSYDWDILAQKYYDTYTAFEKNN